MEKIKQFIPSGITILSQGEIVANSLVKYLEKHPEIAALCTKNSQSVFYTTDSTEDFDQKASIFYGKPVNSIHLVL